MFPEGTRSVDGRVGRFKKGSFLVAVEAGLPIVPVSVSGSLHIMKKGRLTVCPGAVQVVVHDPISTRGVTREGIAELATRVRDIVRADVEQGAHAPLAAPVHGAIHPEVP